MRQSLEQILEDSRSDDARLRRSAARAWPGTAAPAGSTITEGSAGAPCRFRDARMIFPS